MDNWLISLDQRKEENVLERYQLNKFEKDVVTLLKGKRIKLKKYDVLKRKKGGKEIVYDMREKDVVIIEGVGPLNSRIINELADLKVYLQIGEKKYKERFYSFYNWKGMERNYIDVLYLLRMKDEIPIIKKGGDNTDIVIKGEYNDN